MLDGFIHTLGRMGVFLICARMIVHFRPKESDEKYMKLLVSIMILLYLISPLGGVTEYVPFAPDYGWEEIESILNEKQIPDSGQEWGEESSLTLQEVMNNLLTGGEQSEHAGGWEKEDIVIDPVEEISLGD